MVRNYRLLVRIVALTTTNPAFACEPVLPFIQVMAPALALSRSALVLIIAVSVKSVLCALFERRLPRVQAAWRMLLGNVLTTFVGVLVAAMIASGPGVWMIGVPLVCLLCWQPSRRLVKAAPLRWLARRSALGLAGMMTVPLLASCVLLGFSREAIETHQLMLYWTIKLTAIFLALLASVTLTTIWEEWVIWRLSSRPDGPGFFEPALRANLYVLVLVMAIPAVLILPKRLKSPNFLAKRTDTVFLKQRLDSKAE